MVYLFPTEKRRQTARDKIPSLLEQEGMEERLPASIQGRPVSSIEEARVAVALEVIGWRYVYQRAYYGGASRPGGIVIDFLVLTPGPDTPLLVQSRYWHTIRDRRAKDVFQLSRLRSLPNLAEPIEVWDYELQSIKQTIRLLMNKLGSA